MIYMAQATCRLWLPGDDLRGSCAQRTHLSPLTVPVTQRWLCCHQQSGEPLPGPAQSVWLLLTSRISIPEELKADSKIPNYGFYRHSLPQAQTTWQAAKKLPGASAWGGDPCWC